MVREEFQAWREKGGELREREELFLTVSHSIGGLGLLERENATVLNASLRPLARDVIVRLEAAVRSSGLLSCPVYLTQNDGTVARACDALEFPIRCVQSGPVNSVRGAALLSGLTDALVVDVGGTTTDVGTLR